MSRRTGVVLLLIALCLGSCGGGGSRSTLVTASPTPSPIKTTSFYQANRAPPIGREGKIRVDVDQIFGASTEANYAVMNKAIDARDAIGLTEMIAQGRVYRIANDTRLLVIDRSSDLNLSRVRLLEGPSVGAAMWVLTLFLDY